MRRGIRNAIRFSNEAKQTLQLIQVDVVHIIEHGHIASNRIQLQCLLHAMLLAASKQEQFIHRIVVHDVGVNVQQLQSEI